MKVDVNKNVTSRLNVQPLKDDNGKYLYGGMVPVVLESITLEHQDYKTGEFEGMSVPLIRFEFKGKTIRKDDPPRFLTISSKLVGTKVKDGDDYVDAQIEDIEKFQSIMWDKTKHILDNLTASKGFKNLSTIPDTDLKKYFVLPDKGKPETILEKYEGFFNYLVDFVNDNNMTIDKNGKLLEFWIKVLPDYRERKWYTEPGFVKKGWIEPLVKDKDGKLIPPRVIELKPDESLELAKLDSSGALPPGALPAGAAVPADIADLMG